MGSTFQIDSLLLLGRKVYLYEVKNFKGEFYHESSKIFLSSGTEIKNPFSKLLETTSSLRRLLQQMGYSYPIEAAIVFVNPSFTFFQAPRDLPILFLSQLDWHFAKLNHSRVPLSNDLKRLALQLVKRHYADLKRGATCLQSGSFSLYEKGYRICCRQCDYVDWPTNVLLRCAEEFRLFFPDRKLTTSALQDWCQVIDSPQIVRRVLKENFASIGNSSDRHYE